jgi:hypothetical protein
MTTEKIKEPSPFEVHVDAIYPLREEQPPLRDKIAQLESEQGAYYSEPQKDYEHDIAQVKNKINAIDDEIEGHKNDLMDILENEDIRFALEITPVLDKRGFSEGQFFAKLVSPDLYNQSEQLQVIFYCKCLFNKNNQFPEEGFKQEIIDSLEELHFFCYDKIKEIDVKLEDESSYQVNLDMMRTYGGLPNRDGKGDSAMFVMNNSNNSFLNSKKSIDDFRYFVKYCGVELDLIENKPQRITATTYPIEGYWIPA